MSALDIKYKVSLVFVFVGSALTCLCSFYFWTMALGEVMDRVPWRKLLLLPEDRFHWQRISSYHAYKVLNLKLTVQRTI
jgi:hypothetical protein